VLCRDAPAREVGHFGSVPDRSRGTLDCCTGCAVLYRTAPLAQSSRTIDGMSRGVPKKGFMGKKGVQKHGPRTVYQINTAYIPMYEGNQYNFCLYYITITCNYYIINKNILICLICFNVMGRLTVVRVLHSPQFRYPAGHATKVTHCVVSYPSANVLLCTAKSTFGFPEWSEVGRMGSLAV
jgi:hypothetical protein